MTYKSGSNYKSIYKVLLKKADQTKTTDTTAAADTELQTTLPVGTYRAAFHILYKSHATPDLKYGILFTGTASGNIGNTAQSPYTTPMATTLSLSSDDTNEYLLFYATIVVTAIGIFSFAWAQSTSDGNNTTIQKGSKVIIDKVA